MALAMQFTIPATSINCENIFQTQSNLSVLKTFYAGEVAHVSVRFGLPRTATTGNGTALT
jgi:hypothetical protein